ncbi:hypothetical protein [Nocardioides taihuensis]|uniref:Uncharacterized protein n=1 Tax=Nocardioides taihuensis TaxID=1835606 RepID=A0ABW0BEW1_9ACTN
MTQTRPASSALLDLRLALEQPPADQPVPDAWRWVVRKHLAGVRDQLAHEGAHPQDAGLAARDGALLRERDALLRRLVALGHPLLSDPEVEPVRTELRRLAADIAHHEQRLHDLVFDDIELELGGSE